MRNERKNKKSRKVRGAVVATLVILLLTAAAWAAKRSTGPARVEISSVAVSETEWPTTDDAPPVPSSESEQKVTFAVTSPGRGQISTFDISVWTTNSSRIDLGEFSFVLRQIEQIGAHDARTENYIDYIIPDSWNSSQRLTETVTVKELQKSPVRAPIASEPLFRRAADYPAEIPFDEVEIQVDGVNYYTDVNETEYLAWVRLKETERQWDIKSVVISGWQQY